MSLDCGAILDGWHGDAAVSVLVGRDRWGADAGRRGGRGRLWAGIAAAARGVADGGGRLADISLQRREGGPQDGVRHRRGYGGHGVGTEITGCHTC